MRSFDEEESARLNPEPWMLDLLKLNPEYTSWGPHEDYMWDEGEGWDGRQIYASWTEFGPWELNDLNECANFYFSIGRDSKRCETCNGSGTSPDAQWVSESFYKHSSPFVNDVQGRLTVKAFNDRFCGGSVTGQLHAPGSFPSRETLEKYTPEFHAFCHAMRRGDGSWHDKITQDELEALVAGGRLCDYDRDAKEWVSKGLTVDEVNANQVKSGFNSHDGINRWILIDARCKRFGITVTCETCDGQGDVFTAPGAHVSLTLWWLHPRKGCSRGIEVTKIQKAELPQVVTLLKQAAQRNAERFTKVVAL